MYHGELVEVRTLPRPTAGPGDQIMAYPLSHPSSPIFFSFFQGQKISRTIETTNWVNFLYSSNSPIFFKSVFSYNVS